MARVEAKAAQWCSRVRSTATDAHQYFGDVAETMYALLVEALEATRWVACSGSCFPLSADSCRAMPSPVSNRMRTRTFCG